MSDDKVPVGATSRFPFVAPEEGIFQVYSNYIDLAWTLFDVTIRFAQVVPVVPVPSGDELKFEAEENARVTIGWHEAKFLANMLADMVRRFEETNGELKPLKLTPNSDEEKHGKLSKE